VKLPALACKILALWLFTEFVMAIVVVVWMVVTAVCGLRQRDGWHDFVIAGLTGLPSLGTLLIGMFLWFKASWLADRMVSDDPTPVTRPDMTQQTFLAVACAAIGIFTIIPVLRNLVGNFVIIIAGENRFSVYWKSVDWQSNFWSNIVGLAFSIWLMLGSRGIARFVLWLRSAPAPADEETPAG